jgi:hypothetical protein
LNGEQESPLRRCDVSSEGVEPPLVRARLSLLEVILFQFSFILMVEDRIWSFRVVAAKSTSLIPSNPQGAPLVDQPNSKKRSRKIAGFAAVVALAVGGVSSSAHAAIGWGNSEATPPTSVVVTAPPPPPPTAVAPTTTQPRVTTQYVVRFVMVRGRLTRVLVPVATNTTTIPPSNGPKTAGAAGWGN